MYEHMNRLIAALMSGLHERDEAVRLGLLASLAGESMFLLGPPGVGKSLIARRLQMVFTDAKTFSYLMGRFSTPDEVFGPLSIRRLKQDDRYERVTANYLPEADVVFLDEIWKASAPIRNALLTVLNERLYRNGSQEMELPLKVFIGASNELPEDDETAAAFWDRFLIRLVLGPVEDPDAFLNLVRDTEDVYADVVPPSEKITAAQYADIQAELAGIQVPDDIGSLILSIRDRLRPKPSPDGGGMSGEDTIGVSTPHAPVVSDRRWKKIVRLLRASALLHGRSAVEALDCAVIRHCVWNSLGDRPATDAIVREALTEHAARPVVLATARTRLEKLNDRFLSATVEVVEEEVTQPVLYREEYYRLLNAEAKDADAADPEQVLVWHGDIDDLDPEESGTIDVFRYRDEKLAGSETVSARRVGRWALEIAGETRNIETATRIATTTRSREMDPEESEELIRTVRALIDEVRAETDRVVDRCTQIMDQARGHLFVQREDARIITAASERAAEELAKVRLEAEQFLSRVLPAQ